MERLTYEIIDGGMVTDKENIKEFEIEDGFTVCGGNAIFRLSAYEGTGLTPQEIMELKERDTAKDPEEIQDAFGDTRLICPNCRNSVINYFNRSRPPRFCMICGQRLRWEE